MYVIVAKRYHAMVLKTYDIFHMALTDFIFLLQHRGLEKVSVSLPMQKPYGH